MSTHRIAAACAALLVCVWCIDASQAQTTFGFGTKASEREVAGWDIDIAPDGRGLPKGSGSVAQGQKIYEQACAACHGAQGEGKPADRLVGGIGSLKNDVPVKTVGSFWPYATTIYDYVYRAMPADRPLSLTPDEVYAVTAYLLHLNGIVGPDAVMDAATLPKVQMPNRNGFVGDPRPDIVNVPCKTDCK